MTIKRLLTHRFLPVVLVLLICGLMLGLMQPLDAKANQVFASEKQRIVVLEVDYTTYEWWLLSWSNSQVLCQVFVEHEGWPQADEVQFYCGSQTKNQWLNTKPCIFTSQMTSTSQCSGLYLHLANKTLNTRTIEVKLPKPEVLVSISGCNPQPPQNRCETLPYLHLEAEEPLPNEQVIRIQGYINGKEFSCPGAACDIPIPPTAQSGVSVEFWADSSYGDSSERFNAQVRMMPWGDFTNPENSTQDGTTYYVDILSSQYKGEGVSSCSAIWSAFAPVGGPPTWLTTPQLAEDLVSLRPYYYLAGSLIKSGLVDTTACERGGLEYTGAANACGMELARPLVNEWQNIFDSEIIRVANETGIPAQLMKNIFSQESQFWPGIYNKVSEAGLGHLSDLGADTVLLWNPSFFTQFCPLVLSEETCQRGFGNLDLADQEMLRGALVQKVNAGCPDCPLGIDLEQANFSISIFARSILANCEQVGQIIYNSTSRLAGEAVTYEDLWKFTLVNYNAGSGCLINAIQRTMNGNLPITWPNIAVNLEPVCRPAINYVDNISNMPQYIEMPVSTEVQALGGVPETTASPTTTLVIITTPTPTPTEPVYPADPQETPTSYP